MQASPAEIEELRRSIREFAQGSLPPGAARRVADEGDVFDQSSWQVIAESMGLAAIGVPPEYGGAGYSFTELGIVLEELGRALTPAGGPALPLPLDRGLRQLG